MKNEDIWPQAELDESSCFTDLRARQNSSISLLMLLNLISNLHPRMATEDQDPDPTKVLDPPGFLILNYGRGTSLVATVAHLIYGGILDTFYQ